MANPTRNGSRLSIDFDLSRTATGDRLLKKILFAAVSTLYDHVPREAIVDVQVTGSIANGEGTVITTKSGVVSSDLDLIVYLKLPYYLISLLTGLGQKLSSIVTSNLLSTGIRTHACFNLSSSLIQRGTKVYQKSSIYDYESCSNKSLLKRHVDKRARLPSCDDALQLVFTTMAEYVTLFPRSSSQIEKLYWLVKRYLTLLYSILIFEGKPRLTYMERVGTALEILPTELRSSNEAKLVNALLEFKLTGNPRVVFDIFDSKDIKQIIDFLKTRLVDKAVKILSYQLTTRYRHTDGASDRTKTVDLLSLYFTKNRKSTSEILFYTFFLSLVLLVTRRANVAHIIRPAFRSQHSLLHTANYLVGLTFLSRLGSRSARTCANSLINLIQLPQGLGTIERFWQIANEFLYIH